MVIVGQKLIYIKSKKIKHDLENNWFKFEVSYLIPVKVKSAKRIQKFWYFPNIRVVKGGAEERHPDLLTLMSPQVRNQLARPWNMHNSGGRKKGHRAGLFLLLYSLTSYLHRIQLPAFLPQINLPEGATADGLHNSEFFNGGRFWHQDSVHTLPCHRVSPTFLLAPIGGLHCRSAQTEACRSRQNPFSSRNSRQLSSK